MIRTKRGIREEGRKRFAIAHELGHWFLHENESQFFVCTAEQMREYKGSPTEVEANIFASELLMPTFLFRPLAENSAPCILPKPFLASFDAGPAVLSVPGSGSRRLEPRLCPQALGSARFIIPAPASATTA